MSRTILLLLAALPSLALAFAQEPAAKPAQQPAQQGEAAKKTPQDSANYIGAVACRSCHRSKAKGEQYVHWSTKTPHPNGFDELASDKSKEVAAKLNIADAQKDAACLRCHVTAYGVDPKRIDKAFKPEMGVQCESCHGPGSYHKEQRLKAASAQSPEQAQASANATLDIPADEIHLPTEAICRSCHNPDSPTYKPYDHKEFLAKVAHPNPQRKKPDAPAGGEAKSGEGGAKSGG